MVGEAAPIAPVGTGKRAVVLVGGPVAPYSRALRIARALAAEGFDVEIAAIAAPGLPPEESIAGPTPGNAGGPEPAPDAIGRIVLRRYRPSGPWAALGSSTAGTGARTGTTPDVAHDTIARRSGRRLVAPLLAVRRWLLWPHAVRGWWSTLARDLAPAEVYHACGVLALPAALAARERSRRVAPGSRAVVIADAIDDAAVSNETVAMPAPIRGRIARLDRAWARRADLRTTVNEALADALAERWGTDRPIVVPNHPELDADAPRKIDLVAAAALPPGTRTIVFQGRLGPQLGLEAAAEAVLAVPRAALVVLGFGRGLAASRVRDRDPRFAGRHVTLDARPPDELLAWTAAADLAIVPLPPTSANQRRSTPNKFWEALSAGTPVVVGADLPVMAAIVRAHDLGIVAASSAAPDLATAILAGLDRLDAEGEAWRERISSIARERFGWPAAATAYRAAVRMLVGGS